METVRLGRSGLKVSRIALGCMSFGDAVTRVQRVVPRRGGGRAALPAGRRARHHLLGHRQRLRRTAAPRRSSAAPSRRTPAARTSSWRPSCTSRMHDGPGGSGLSRKAIMEQIDASLTRLGTDYVDLYQIHRFDPDTPVEETMEALHDVVKAGKARYIGASSMWAWQFATMQHAADLHGWTRFVSMQDQYNLHAARGGARDVRPARRPGRRQHPLRARSPRDGSPGRGASTPSGSTPTRSASGSTSRRTAPIVDAVKTVAEARGVPMAHVALAWVLHNPVVAAPIVGATKALPPARRGRGPRRPPHRRRGPHPRGAVRPARADGLLKQRRRLRTPGHGVLGTAWRWRWDLNPRRGCPLTRFRGVLLRPLGHATADEDTRGGTVSRVALPGRKRSPGLTCTAMVGEQDRAEQHEQQPQGDLAADPRRRPGARQILREDP